jgi:hypothetical protein
MEMSLPLAQTRRPAIRQNQTLPSLMPPLDVSSLAELENTKLLPP